MNSTDASVVRAREVARFFIEKLCFMQVTTDQAQPPTVSFMKPMEEAIGQVEAILKDAFGSIDHSEFLDTLRSPSNELERCAGAVEVDFKLDSPEFSQRLAQAIRASSDPDFVNLRKQYTGLNAGVVRSALEAMNLQPPAGDEPRTSVGNYIPVGRIHLDARTASAADTVVQQASQGKISSLEFIVKKLESAEHELIRLGRERQTALPAPTVLVDASQGQPVKMNAADVFADAVKSRDDKDLLDFEVTAYRWPHGQAKIPVIDPTYHFNVEVLRTLLFAAENQKNAALVGPPGCGKSKQTQQIAARLSRPYFRIPIDGEMRRREMIGGIKQVATPTGSEMRYFDGVLVQAMGLPSFICFDEFDRMDPDLAYLMHQALEGEGLTLLDDGERFIPPHPHMAIIGTANTKGVADAMNRFNMVNELSEATRDRFPFFIDVDYMKPSDEAKTLVAKVPGLTDADAAQLARTAEFIRGSYKDGNIRTACSFRQIEEAARFGVFVKSMPKAVKTILVKRAATEDDEATIAGFGQQVYGAAWDRA